MMLWINFGKWTDAEIGLLKAKRMGRFIVKVSPRYCTWRELPKQFYREVFRIGYCKVSKPLIPILWY